MEFPLQETGLDSTRHLHCSPSDWLRESELVPCVDAFTHHLGERRYATQTVCTYQVCIARRASGRGLCVRQIDEDVIRQFLDDHLPRCNCAKPVRGTRQDLRAALGHLLVDLAMKVKALARLQEPATKKHRYRPPDALMKFLQAL